MSSRWREGTPAWERMREHSPTAWDQSTRYSPSAFKIDTYIATCMACGRSVEPTDPAAWRRAVQTLQCEYCGSRLLVDIENVSGGLQSPNIGRVRKRTDDTPFRTHVA